MSLKIFEIISPQTMSYIAHDKITIKIKMMTKMIVPITKIVLMNKMMTIKNN